MAGPAWSSVRAYQQATFLLIVIALVALTSCSRFQDVSRTEELSLGPGERSSIAVDLSKGDVLRGAATIVGNPNVDVGVWLEDPSGKIVVPQKRGKSIDFSYGAIASGRHHIIVNNADSLFTGKVVSLKWTVDR